MTPEEQLSLGPPEGDGGGDSARVQRLPRWTRQEILVLIQGKRVAEGLMRRRRAGRAAAVASDSEPLEPKWALVSSYCRRHGVNRGPIQCRKRWSNLAGDFKKISKWESRAGEAAESFWAMRNDARRERRLPGFFDREVYDILDGAVEVAESSLALALAPAVAEEACAKAEEILFDSGRSVAAEDGLFSDFEQEEGGGDSPRRGAKTEAEKPEIPTPIPLRISTRPRGISDENRVSTDSPDLELPPQEVRKRKRLVSEPGDEETAMSLHDRLINVLERNGELLTEQLQVQDRNSRLDRDQRKDQADGLLGALGKLADALAKIAGKL